MFSTVSSASIYGIEARIIQVEADVSDGLPLFNMVGFLASEVREARDRVRTALKNSNYALRPKHITINLSPADIRKAGTGFDLPIALAVLAASEIIPNKRIADTLVVGELSLEGRIRRINGVLPIAQAAKKAGFTRCIVPADNACEGAVVKGIDVIGVDTLRDLVDYLYGEYAIKPAAVDTDSLFGAAAGPGREDFADITGQVFARRAVEVAVSGQHNILLSGPPGAGKTMLARRIPGIMPRMSFEESLEISRIYSIAGRLDKDRFLVTDRPFCAPHHTATVSSLIGGGMFATPGAVSLSHNGVLFLDELPEFGRESIEALRQPLEDRRVCVTRLNGSYIYPAGFMLVASMNPCPCGYWPDRNRCMCTPAQIQRYRQRISQPILDRIDLQINVDRVEYSSLKEESRGEASEDIRRRVEAAGRLQAERFRGLGISFNSQMNAAQIRQFCALEPDGESLMEQAFTKYDLSARGYHRILKVARTIADMDGAVNIGTQHLAEALCYRGYDSDPAAVLR